MYHFRSAYTGGDLPAEPVRPLCYPAAVDVRTLDSLAVVADAHLAGEDPASIAAFGDLLDGLVGRVEGLAILGDLFEVWAALPHLLADHQRGVVERLAEAARAGLRIFYLEGNRDYRVSVLRGAPFETVERGLGLRVAGQSVWLAHGDLVNRADRQYRLWCAVTRSRPVGALLRLLPGRSGRRLLAGIEGRLRATNVAHKSYFPTGEAEAYLDERAAQGSDLVVLGHFHQERVLRRGKAVLWSLPAWGEERRWLQINEAGVLLQEPAGGPRSGTPAR
jgi:UDP-2,3-diacylglucosamine hydrolase